MNGVVYKAITDFDPKKDYGVYLPDRAIKGLKQFTKDQEFEQVDIIRQWMENCPVKMRVNEPNMIQYVYYIVRLGKQIGIIERLTDRRDQEFEEFSKLQSVKDWMNHLKDPKQKHPEAIAKKGESGTQYQYRRLLFQFNKWLPGEKIKLTHWKSAGVDKDGDAISKKVSEEVTIKDVQQLLELYEESKKESETAFQKLFYRYLTDPMHKGKMAGSMHTDKCAIESYFTKNYNPLKIIIDVTGKYNVNNGENGQKTKLTLNDLFNMLTLGRPKIIEKAIVMCKFHRGLDNSTFSDAFNFEAWEQLVKYFKTENYESWDLELCPVPINLVRMKTQFDHLGFLDRDAIESLQAWLRQRYELMNGPMSSDKPLFVTQKSTPITDSYVACIIPKLARNAGINKKLTAYTRMNRYQIKTHELRDLLDTTLETHGASTYLAELSIGHKTKSSYRKGGQLYPDKMRREYMKASKALNIFSQVSNYIEKRDENEIELENHRQKVLKVEEDQKRLAELLDNLGKFMQTSSETEKLNTEILQAIQEDSDVKYNELTKKRALLVKKQEKILSRDPNFRKIKENRQ